MNPVVWAFLAMVLIFVIMYNSVISKKNQVDQAFSSIDAYLKMRYDLIPNLVAMVKQYMAHESQTLTKLTELRSKALSISEDGDQKIKINQEIGKLMRPILLQVENYPQLSANQNFMKLQITLVETEAQISAARRAYNAAVTELNNSTEMFPTNIIAKLAAIKPRTLFHIQEDERKNVNVDKLFKAS